VTEVKIFLWFPYSDQLCFRIFY